MFGGSVECVCGHYECVMLYSYLIGEVEKAKVINFCCNQIIFQDKNTNKIFEQNVEFIGRFCRKNVSRLTVASDIYFLVKHILWITFSH